jgi:hypothetical protein
MTKIDLPKAVKNLNSGKSGMVSCAFLTAFSIAFAYAVYSYSLPSGIATLFWVAVQAGLIGAVFRAGLGYKGIKNAYGLTLGIGGFAAGVVLCIFQVLIVVFSVIPALASVFPSLTSGFTPTSSTLSDSLLWLQPWTLLVFGLSQLIWGTIHVACLRSAHSFEFTLAAGVFLLSSGLATTIGLANDLAYTLGLLLFVIGAALAAISLNAERSNILRKTTTI